MSSTLMTVESITLAQFDEATGGWPDAEEVRCTDGETRVMVEVYSGQRDTFAEKLEDMFEWYDLDDDGEGADLAYGPPGSEEVH